MIAHGDGHNYGYETDSAKSVSHRKKEKKKKREKKRGRHVLQSALESQVTPGATYIHLRISTEMRGDGRCCAASAPHIQVSTLSGTAGRVDRQVRSRKRALPTFASSYSGGIG